MLLMVYKEVLNVGTVEEDLQDGIKGVLSAYDDVFPKELRPGLPLIRGIEHRIELVLEAQLPNRLTYRVSPEEAREVEKQVSALME